MNACLIIPYYNHGGAIARVLDALRTLNLPCFIVDDGSDATAKEALERALANRSYPIHAIALTVNQGKGVAVMTGCQRALEAGFTHGVQIDADGQHQIDDIPRMLKEAERLPHALIAGQAVYDESVPRSRLYGRYVTHLWVWINTLSFSIKDSLCGFRVYPLKESCEIWAEQGHRIGKRMDFDPEIMVRMAWKGTPVVSVPTLVTYASDGVSHFDLLRDNVRISYMHARLFFGMLWRSPLLIGRRLFGRSKRSVT